MEWARVSKLVFSQVHVWLTAMDCTDKEHWEPMLRYLFSHQNSQQPNRIREAWCFDWLNHGDAAVINKTALEHRSPGDVCESDNETPCHFPHIYISYSGMGSGDCVLCKITVSQRPQTSWLGTLSRFQCNVSHPVSRTFRRS
jgi:hypothetical protein